MTRLMTIAIIISCLSATTFCSPNEDDEMTLKESILEISPPSSPTTGDRLNYTGMTQTVDETGRPKRWVMIGHRKWTRMPVTISFKNFLPTISKFTQVQILKECLTMWSEASGISFKIVDKRRCPRWSQTRCTDIEVQFLYMDGKWNVAGRGLSPTPTWTNSTSSWLKLDTAESWKARHRSYSPSSAISLKWAMCHEVGHNIALGHTKIHGAYMAAGGRLGHLEDELHKDDITGVQALYGPPNGKTVVVDNFNFTPPPPTTPRPTQRRPSVRPRWRVTTSRPVKSRRTSTYRPFTYTSPKTLKARRKNTRRCRTYEFNCVWRRLNAKKIARRTG